MTKFKFLCILHACVSEWACVCTRVCVCAHECVISVYVEGDLCKHEGQERLSVIRLYRFSPYSSEIKSLTTLTGSTLVIFLLVICESWKISQPEMEMWLSGEALGWQTLASGFDSCHTGRQGGRERGRKRRGE